MADDRADDEEPEKSNAETLRSKGARQEDFHSSGRLQGSLGTQTPLERLRQESPTSKYPVIVSCTMVRSAVCEFMT